MAALPASQSLACWAPGSEPSRLVGRQNSTPTPALPLASLSCSPGG